MPHNCAVDRAIALWRVPVPEALLWYEWETEYTIFDRNSGETHLINELPAQILRHLSERPASSPELAAKLAHLCEVENDKSWAAQTSGIINNLAALGLVEALSQ